MPESFVCLSGEQTAQYYPIPRLETALEPLKKPRNPNRLFRRGGRLLGAFALALASPFLVGQLSANGANADAAHTGKLLDICGDRPANFGRPTVVDIETYEQREQFYDDYADAENFVSDHRRIPGVDVSAEDTLCRLTDESSGEATVISPLATVHIWEMEGMAPDAGAVLVPNPSPGQGYFDLRQEGL